MPAKQLRTTRISAFIMDNSTKKTLLAILSFLIPIIGLIIWLVNKDSNSEVGKACGIAALVGFVFNMILFASV